MTDIVLEQWASFFSAASNAAGALVGLIFVALSVNVREILRHRGLPERAGATVATLLMVLAGSLAALIRDQTPVSLGVEVTALGIVVWFLHVLAARFAIQARNNHLPHARRTTLQIIIGQLQVLPYLTGGILLTMGKHYGLYCLAGGSISAFVGALLNAWVLLIEILR